MTDDAGVLVRRQGPVGRLTLDRPGALNALTAGMIHTLLGTLEGWAEDPAVAAVVVDGAGPKGLCAGGDVRFLVDDARDPASRGRAGAAMLAEEYRLDALVARYPKPYVALMDGVVMGGGVGISAHGSVRVVTERTMLAMPEVTIGYVPDVGGTWLLSHTPGELGTHVALTSARLGAAEAIACGLADRQVPSDRHSELVDALVAGGDPAEVVDALAVDPGPAPLLADRGWIDACYGADTVPGILAALRQCDEPGARKAADAIGRAAPLALVMTLRALRAARAATVEEALSAEYVTSRCSMRWPDFPEGVRALLVDRDGAPRWSPPTLDEVTGEVVERFLAGALDTDPELRL
ncbi:3-hydroxyisobutyryl-CoA hydrolase [Pseudonocardia sp. RS11V-5]|uniref:3-hydroxyisobutyryl-CoA hydrolase n=1 Tax=Pseudonocardia terrae TaxID=2905831 RepID=UPI001E3E5A2D|nr:3-hydroxyisobutyryl-CoA hydrolase [Pseudonocardia terrae]MCE3551746.1 3-hydroxyisobutyryl-CoA hydrolase [Pseudonocardia terrae]